MGIDVAVARAPEGAADVIDAQRRDQRRQLADLEHARILDPERPLMGDARREQRDVRVGVAEPRVARADEADVGRLREPIEGAAGEDAQVDPERIGVLRLDDADGQARRAGCELVALEHLDRDAGVREGIGNAAADDAAADDEDACHADSVRGVRRRGWMIPATATAPKCHGGWRRMKEEIPPFRSP